MKLTWTTNGEKFMAIHRGQWALIEPTVNKPEPFFVSVGTVSRNPEELVIDIFNWTSANKCNSLKEAQAWAAMKLGVEESFTVVGNESDFVTKLRVGDEQD